MTPNDFLILSPAHWVAVVIVSVSRGVARYRLLDDEQVRTGRARQTRWNSTSPSSLRHISIQPWRR